MKVFLGWDNKEIVAYHVATHSIITRTNEPIGIYPVMLNHLPMWRDRHKYQSTDFAFSRFLVPWACGYEGWSLFMDCDVLVRCDVREIFNLADPRKAVHVVKHNYIPKGERKFLDQTQTQYPRKNWSSVVLFNNAMCRQLTPEFVNGEQEGIGLHLHRFEWLDDHLIGELPSTYNHLVGEYDPNPDAKIVHFTQGGPWFPDYFDCEFSTEWRRERQEAGI